MTLRGLTRTDIAAIGLGAAISFAAAAVVSAAIYVATGEAPTTIEPPDGLASLVAFGLGSIVLSPVVETAGLAGLFRLLRSKAGVWLSCGLCVLAFATIHGFRAPAWGLIAFIPGVVYMRSFALLGDGRMRGAMLRSGLTHALHNAFVMLAVSLLN